MNFTQRMENTKYVLMEGALGERLKREFHLTMDPDVVMGKLVYTKEGREALKTLWLQYADIAAEYHLPFLATTTTRRTNKERAQNANAPESILEDNVKFLRTVQNESHAELYVGGLMGCYGDAYTGAGALSAKASRNFHTWEAEHFLNAHVDFVYAALLPTLPEARGIAEALSDTDLPYILSFTLQRNGCLIDGTTLSAAIEQIDCNVPNPPLCYMTNCIHPAFVCEALQKDFNQTEIVKQRFWGVQGNTAKLTYKELDNAAELKTSPPEDFAEDMLCLKALLPAMRIFGGCCGTDATHMKAIAEKLR